MHSDIPTPVTVIIPTINRGSYLVDCVADLLLQDYPDYDVLIVDQSEREDERLKDLVAAGEGRIHHHRVTLKGLPLARNYGWNHATNDALIYIDDDTRCPQDFVHRHAQALNQPGVGLVAGGMDEPVRGTDYGPPTGSFNRLTATPKAGFGAFIQRDVTHARGANFSVWKHVLKEAGGFDEALNVGSALYEELELCLRIGALGYRVYFDGLARLTHLVAPSGGCRVEDVERYVESLAHNRSLVIRRHIGFMARPIAIGRLALLTASYAKSYGKPGALVAGVRGALRGWQCGSRQPVASAHAETRRQ